MSELGKLELKTIPRSEYFAVRVGKLAAVLSQDEALWVASCYLRGDVHPYLRSACDWESNRSDLKEAFPDLFESSEASNG